jgi:hypothetical protein
MPQIPQTAIKASMDQRRKTEGRLQTMMNQISNVIGLIDT